MNRDIEFKCFYGGQMHDHKEAMRIMYNNTTGLGGTNAHFLQYVGRKTKEGEKIFEDYIVSVMGKKRVGLYTTVVVHKGYGFTLKENKTNMTDAACLIAVKEILGNIHENPELLNK